MPRGGDDSVSDVTQDPLQAPPAPATIHDLDEQEMRNRLRGALFGAPALPTRIGRYAILEKIGAGGLGVVYAAYDPELDRRVALKLVHPDRLTSKAALRMQREAQAMARLAHPNVVAVHDVGTHAGGTFMAMELVDGVTLDRWIAQANPTWQNMRDVLVQAAAGLIAAHEQGLVHRDFKPGNVLVDRQGRARVLDFGLARATLETDIDESGSDHPNAGPPALLELDLTQGDALLGTPAYMAPEQFEGRADMRSDQWSFCVTAFEAFYGVRPFSGRNLDELRAATCASEPRLPANAPAIPSWLHRAIRRGLEVDANARHPSMRALVQALQSDLRSRRKQWLALGGAVLLSLVTAGTTAVLVRPDPSPEARAMVERLEEDARLAAAAGRFVYPPADAPELATALVHVLELEQLDGPVAGHAHARAEALRSQFADALVELGDAYWERDGGQPFAADFYGAALIFAPDHPRARERSTLTPGQIAALKTRASERSFSRSELVGAEALAILAEPDERVRARKVADVLGRSDSVAASTRTHLERLAGAPTVEPSSEPSDLVTHDPVAAAREVAGEHAGPPLPRSRNAEPGSGRKRDLAAARGHAQAGKEASTRGRYDEAEQAFHRALNEDPGNQVALSGLSDLYFERGAFQKALTYAQKAVNASPKNARFRMQLGDVLFKVHRYADARRQYVMAEKHGHPNARAALERIDRRLGSD